MSSEVYNNPEVNGWDELDGFVDDLDLDALPDFQGLILNPYWIIPEGLKETFRVNAFMTGDFYKLSENISPRYFEMLLNSAGYPDTVPSMRTITTAVRDVVDILASTRSCAMSSRHPRYDLVQMWTRWFHSNTKPKMLKNKIAAIIRGDAL